MNKSPPFFWFISFVPNPEQILLCFQISLSQFLPKSSFLFVSFRNGFLSRECKKTTYDLQNANLRTKCEYKSFFLSESVSTILDDVECRGINSFERFSTIALISAKGRFLACADSISASTASTRAREREIMMKSERVLGERERETLTT